MTDRTCSIDQCDKPPFNGRGWCAAHYQRWRRHGSPTFGSTFTCNTCGETFPRQGRSGPAPKTCAECSAVMRLARYDPDAKRRPRGESACRTCGAPCVNVSWCSDSCRQEFYRFDGKPRPTSTPCGRCGEPIDLTEILADGRMRTVRTKLHPGCRRRSKYYGLTLDELVARDGTGCNICGATVDLDVPAPHNMSPSIDHVIPWSLGGPNEPSNLALTHRICNVRKGVAV